MQTPATPPPADGPADEASLAEVFRQHQASLTTYAFQILGDLESARDAVQDTFIRLCEAETAALPDHVTAWLFTVCRRRALDFLRKGKRMQPLTGDEIAHRSDEGPSPAEKTEIRDGASHLPRLLSRLKPDQRDVLLLKFHHALSYQQIADVTGHSVGNVGFLLHTGPRELRRLFQRELEPESFSNRRTP